MRLAWSNAKLYNRHRSELWEAADRLSVEFEALFCDWVINPLDRYDLYTSERSDCFGKDAYKARRAEMLRRATVRTCCDTCLGRRHMGNESVEWYILYYIVISLSLSLALPLRGGLRRSGYQQG